MPAWLDFKTILEILTLVGLVIAGIFAVLGYIDKSKTAKEDESKKVDDRLILLLKDQVAVLEKKVSDLESQAAENQRKLQKLEARNEILEEVFQGRDKQTQDFQKAGFEAIKNTQDVLKIVTQTNKNVERLYQVIEKYLAIEADKKGGE